MQEKIQDYLDLKISHNSIPKDLNMCSPVVNFCISSYVFKDNNFFMIPETHLLLPPQRLVVSLKDQKRF